VTATVQELYRALLAAWNEDDAEAFAAAFAEDGEVIGFDGSELHGRAAIASELGRIFADHATGSYVGIVRSVRPLGEDAFLLRAVAGVVPAGAGDLKPELNSVQSLVASWHDGRWLIDLYHNTPAQLHGRPEAAAALTAELRGQLPPDRD
jgi:uncharacterized protein (TIGR02246 family)